MRPSKPTWRSVSAAFAPAKLAPTIANVWLLVISDSSPSTRTAGELGVLLARLWKGQLARTTSSPSLRGSKPYSCRTRSAVSGYRGRRRCCARWRPL